MSKKLFICPVCNKEFLRWEYTCHREGRSGILYCSTDCFNTWQKRNRIKINCTNCNKEIFLRNNQQKSQAHHFCSKDCQFNWMRGKNHHFWKGGKERYYGDDWNIQKRLTLKRDKICKSCGNEKELEVHHIIPHVYSNDNSLENLIVLCKSCHINIGDTYWRVEDRPKYFEKINTMRFK
jgi:endogenous inhibitor of DNA gyrase (YacG/DUF329 family)